MAVDEAVLKSASDIGQSTLRFYGWQPATLSLGYFQQLQDRNLHQASRDCMIVRRASGGGAILHDIELTYAFATPVSIRRSGAEAMYFSFHETLVAALSEFGVEARLHRSDEGLRDTPFLCFERRADGDVVCQGYKVAGSAQRRWKNALLQHGSILIRKSLYAPELPGLSDLANFSGDAQTIVERWLPKLSTELKTDFHRGTLTDKEFETVRELRSEKFSRDSWIGRR